MNLSAMPDFPKGTPAFVEMLKKHEPFIQHWDLSRPSAPDELSLLPGGISLEPAFPDPEKLLDTAYADFRRFLAEAELSGGKIPVKVKETAGFPEEAYRLTIEKEGIRLEGSDTEGIRRGLYYLRDLIAASPFLKLGVHDRKPWLKNRISRCFFGPIKRPPFNIDELMNDIDYYPEEYLSRLAHEGINGLWLTITFREICDTSIRKATPDAARRQAKLRATVERCRRYGIRIWVFCIEPAYWAHCIGNPVPEGCEELLGPGGFDINASEQLHSFCANSPAAQKYLYECTHSLFSAVPNLGGMITISHGERMTSCLSLINAHSDDGTIPCVKRCSHSIGEILAMTLGPMKRGMRDANPKAELISWLYMPYVDQVGNWITQMPSKLDADIALAFNFESGVNKYQLGKVRTGGDYWLSEIGPSDRFNVIAQAAKGHCSMAAKLQVACSHECATVPYIPAPGLVYRKYRKMKDLGVKHVIQCWYFGNYPGVMNEAAGKLAYEDFSGTEDDFLVQLAAPEWGRDYPAVVQAWKHFAEGYSNYPLDIQFQYYGPMHDGPVWPLHLKQVMTPLTRSWKPDLFPAGDALGECMKHFELEELAELSGKISKEWHRGMEILRQAEVKGHELEFTLAEALDIMFRSGRNILKFYAMRSALMDDAPDSGTLLAGMRKIAEEEIRNSLRLAELCRQDARLGYHSEAEVYKYFPAKLEWRAECLRELLAQDFAEAEVLLDEGAELADFLALPEPPATAGGVYGENGIRWSFESDAENITFHVELEGRNEFPETVWLLFSDRKGIRKPPEPVEVIKGSAGSEFISQEQTPSGWRFTCVLPREELHYESCFRFGVQRIIYEGRGKVQMSYDKPGSYMTETRLYLGYYDPRKLTPVQL